MNSSYTYATLPYATLMTLCCITLHYTYTPLQIQPQLHLHYITPHYPHYVTLRYTTPNFSTTTKTTATKPTTALHYTTLHYTTLQQLTTLHCNLLPYIPLRYTRYTTNATPRRDNHNEQFQLSGHQRIRNRLVRYYWYDPLFMMLKTRHK